MNADDVSKEFQKQLENLNSRYQTEYDSLYKNFLGKTFDAQICNKLNTILEKNLLLTPFGFAMNGFDYNNLTLYQPEILRVKQVFEKEIKNND